MARKSVIARNEKRKRLVESMAKKRNKLKRKIKDVSLSMQERFECQTSLSKMSRNSSRIRVRSRCMITGRPRGVYTKFFGISRSHLRTMALSGEIPGVKKFSW